MILQGELPEVIFSPGGVNDDNSGGCMDDLGTVNIRFEHLIGLLSEETGGCTLNGAKLHGPGVATP